MELFILLFVLQGKASPTRQVRVMMTPLFSYALSINYIIALDESSVHIIYMETNYHSLILIYTIHDDGMRNSFLAKVKECFKNCMPINESTYSLKTEDIGKADCIIRQIYSECKQQSTSNENDYISLLYSPVLKKESYHGMPQMNQVVERHIIGSKYEI